MNPRLMQVEVQQYRKMQSHALQCGVLTRSSRLLLNCRTLDDLAETLVSTFGALSLVGQLRIEAAGTRASRNFGGSTNATPAGGLANVEAGQSMPDDDAKRVVFRSAHLAVLGRQEGAFVPVAALQDNLAVFIDTVETWLVKYEADLWRRQAIEYEKISSTEQLEELGKRLCELSAGLLAAGQLVSQDLLTRLVAQFPVLALHADQEEAILETVTQALIAQERHIESQREQLSRVTRELTRAVRRSADSIDGQRRAEADFAFKRVVGSIHLRSGHDHC